MIDFKPTCKVFTKFAVYRGKNISNTPNGGQEIYKHKLMSWVTFGKLVRTLNSSSFYPNVL